MCVPHSSVSETTDDMPCRTQVRAVEQIWIEDFVRASSNQVDITQKWPVFYGSLADVFIPAVCHAMTRSLRSWRPLTTYVTSIGTRSRGDMTMHACSSARCVPSAVSRSEAQKARCMNMVTCCNGWEAPPIYKSHNRQQKHTSHLMVRVCAGLRAARPPVRVAAFVLDCHDPAGSNARKLLQCFALLD